MRRLLRGIAPLLLASLLASALTGTALGWDWPGEELSLAAGFGQLSDDGDLRTGIRLSGEIQPIHAAHEGEVVFRFDAGERFGTIPHGLGNFVVVEHERQFRMLYGHLRPPLVDADRESVTPEDLLGSLGASGHATGPGLLLQVRDRERGVFVNPEVILPKQEDEQLPVVEALYLRRPGGEAEQQRELRSGSTVRPGEVELLATVYDPNEGNELFPRRPVFRISVSLAGNSRTMSFDTIDAEDGRVLLAGRYSRDDVYADDWLYRLMELALEPGSQELTIAVEDYAGNRNEIDIPFTVLESES
jgi:hypothetical protein